MHSHNIGVHSFYFCKAYHLFVHLDNTRSVPLQKQPANIPRKVYKSVHPSYSRSVPIHSHHRTKHERPKTVYGTGRRPGRLRLRANQENTSLRVVFTAAIIIARNRILSFSTCHSGVRMSRQRLAVFPSGNGVAGHGRKDGVPICACGERRWVVTTQGNMFGIHTTRGRR